MEITVAVILSYISKYLLAFTVSLLGGFAYQVQTASKSKKKILFLSMIAPSLLCGFTMTALQDRFHSAISIYAFLCFIFGMNGYYIMELFVNKKLITKVIATIIKNTIKNGTDIATQLASEINEEDDNKKKSENNKIK